MSVYAWFRRRNKYERPSAMSSSKTFKVGLGPGAKFLYTLIGHQATVTRDSEGMIHITCSDGQLSAALEETDSEEERPSERVNL